MKNARSKKGLILISSLLLVASNSNATDHNTTNNLLAAEDQLNYSAKFVDVSILESLLVQRNILDIESSHSYVQGLNETDARALLKSLKEIKSEIDGGVMVMSKTLSESK